MAVTIPIWPGSGSFSSGSSTPFGFFDTDSQFQSDAPKVAQWCARRLGYPIIDVELQDINFFTCLEEAVNEYSSQVNMYRAKENMLSLQGSDLSLDLKDTNMNANMQNVVNIAKDYGTQALSGGKVTVYTGSFLMVGGQQIYDLGDDNIVSLENGSVSNGVTLRRVFHQQPPAIIRYFDPFVGTGMGSQQMMNTFGWGAYSPGVSFMMQPMFDDLLRLQAIEMNDYIRKSSYGFHIDGQRIRLYPIPAGNDTGAKVYFDYTLDSEVNTPIANINVVSDLSNAPFGRLTYTNINTAGKQWIARYALALAKEMLGAIRSKFSSIPIPGADVTLDGSDLRNEASAEKETLLTQLGEMLDATSRRALMEARKEESEFLEETLNRVPNPIFIG
mgnify:CR=1 FL=1|jgi:hypothetical protein|tara:strand:- start:26873 stop:28036 length:1164 start_codon:yes stop_codon:yes gene_type:complete